MKYSDGSIVALGDIVTIPLQNGLHDARIVMLGDTFEHLNLDEAFVNWVKTDKILGEASIAVQWIGDNPLAHKDPRYAPVGDIMFTSMDEDFVKK